MSATCSCDPEHWSIGDADVVVRDAYGRLAIAAVDRASQFYVAQAVETVVTRPCHAKRLGDAMQITDIGTSACGDTCQLVVLKAETRHRDRDLAVYHPHSAVS